MAWGGGWGGGPGMGGQHPGATGSTGLPFGGIPQELMDGVKKIVADEPTHRPANLAFQQLPNEAESRRLTTKTSFQRERERKDKKRKLERFIL